MSHVLGVYWAPGHQRPTDIEYMTHLQPPVIRILDPGVGQIAMAYQACPNALILPRDWALSEQHDDVRIDPERTGKRHAQEWRQKIDQWRMARTPLPPDNQIVVVGINEPRVWDMLPQVVTYTVAMLDECTRLGLRACALNLSVGWPANTGEGTPPDWTPYKPVEAAITRGDHFLTLHSYWYKSGPQDGAGWWAWRHRACPWDVPIIIGETGVDLYVDMERWANDGKPNRGWRGNLSPEQYAAQIEQYARGCDRRVVAILPFLTDYRANIWESFDTAEAHPHLLARKDNMVPQVAPPTQPSTPSVFIPQAGTGTGATQPAPVPMYVAVPNGANLRDTPGMTTLEKSTVLKAVPYGERVDMLAVSADPRWLRVRHEGTEGYMLALLLSSTPPGTQQPPTPAPNDTQELPSVTPAPSGDCWERAWPIVLNIEGGLSLDPNDTGNYYNGQLIGTKYGISAKQWAGLYDIPNLTKEQALAIYKEYYFDAVNAGAYPWPMCLILFDTAIQHGVGVAKELLNYKPTPEEIYLGQRALRYMDDPKWRLYGEAWGVRVDHLRDIAKGKVNT